MVERKNEILSQLIDGVSRGQVTRRQFMASALRLGIAAPVASSLATMARRGALAGGAGSYGPRAYFQDGGKTLVVAIAQSTVQLDPAIAGANGYGDIIPITGNLFEGLTRFKDDSAEIEPALAESWTRSEDGLSYVFKIRPGVTFHDGTPLDAKAVETNFLRQLDPNHPLHFEGITYAEIVFAEVAGVEATGELELTIRLNRPIILVPGNLAMFAAGIASPTALEQYGLDFSQHAAGTGPFKLESWTKDVELVFVANEDYWGGRPALDRVVWRTVAEDTVRVSELKTGGIDIANQIDLKDVEDLQNDPNLQVITGTYLNVQFLGMNQTIPPFDNPKVRQAMQYAINKQNIADVVFYGNYTLGAGPIAPGLPGYDPSLAEVYTYDPERAKALLEEAGVSGLTFDLYNRTTSFWPLLGQLVQADLAAIGVTANLVSLEDAQFFAELNASRAPAFLNDWTWDNGDPDNVMYSLFTAPRAKTRLGYENPEVNRLNLQAQEEPDPEKRAEIYIQAQRLILEDSIKVILGYPSKAIGASARVQNLKLSPTGNLFLRNVDLASE
ncbi:MAG TPA: ABC transporter substrate-binding protein [Thermomicrobiales bacterium]